MLCDKLKHGICEDIQHFRIEFRVSGVQRLSQGFERMLIMKELSWKNKLRFVKDVCKFNFYCNFSS